MLPALAQGDRAVSLVSAVPPVAFVLWTPHLCKRGGFGVFQELWPQLVVWCENPVATSSPVNQRRSLSPARPLF